MGKSISSRVDAVVHSLSWLLIQWWWGDQHLLHLTSNMRSYRHGRSSRCDPGGWSRRSSLPPPSILRKCPLYLCRNCRTQNCRAGMVFASGIRWLFPTRTLLDPLGTSCASLCICRMRWDGTFPRHGRRVGRCATSRAVVVSGRAGSRARDVRRRRSARGNWLSLA